MSKALQAVALLFLANGILFSSWAARVPDLQEQYNLSYQQLGWILLSQSIGALIAMPLCGYLINRFGSKRLVSILGIAFLLITPLIACFESIGILIPVMAAIGMSTGSMDVAMNAQAVLVEQDLNKNLMSRFHAVFSIGMMIGAGLSAWTKATAVLQKRRAPAGFFAKTPLSFQTA